ncbi:hypothetical protein HYALB_00006763 [Hymenoscyphus albidus]|uniref:Uncharacterized protein n=1 Tax=Hymenoscyphus albidus TaxID=595503 RepID=A0A9N9M429_9HELO|nr:hypothetical protein HYALB_00006763 [Hymenoscyphus albidus]
MPRNNGIEFSLVCLSNLGTLPEFPHPDNTQFTNRFQHNDRGDAQGQTSDAESDTATDAGSYGAFERELISPSHAVKVQSKAERVLGKEAAAVVHVGKPTPKIESKADRVLGRQTAVSVYVPAVPDTRWWLKYRIHKEAEHQLFFFKFFINGREIVSWGHDAAKNPFGQVSRAFFDPSDEFVYEDEDGTIYKECGLELRAFYFVDPRGGSAAADGGLIEVRAYRAKGKFRCMQDPPTYKSQRDYGILLRSGGLMDDASDARFYKWLLKDPIDKPYATFKFHYRSWATLLLLQIVPENAPHILIPPSKSTLDLYGHSLATQYLLDEKHFKAYEREEHKRREREFARKLARASLKSRLRMSRVYLPRISKKVENSDEEEGWENCEDGGEGEGVMATSGYDSDGTSLNSPRTVVPADYRTVNEDDLRAPTIAERPGTPFESMEDDDKIPNVPDLETISHRHHQIRMLRHSESRAFSNEYDVTDEVAPKKYRYAAISTNDKTPVLLSSPIKLRSFRPSYPRHFDSVDGATKAFRSPMEVYQESKAAAWSEKAQNVSPDDTGGSISSALNQRPLPSLPVRDSSLQNKPFVSQHPLTRFNSTGHKYTGSSEFTESLSDGEGAEHISSFVHQRKRSGSLIVTSTQPRQPKTLQNVCKHKRGSDNLAQAYAVRGPGSSPVEDHGFHFFDVPSEYQPRAEDLPPWQTGYSDSDSDMSDVERPCSSLREQAVSHTPRTYTPTEIPLSKFNEQEKSKAKSEPTRISSNQDRPSLAPDANPARTSTSTGRKTPTTPAKSPKSLRGFRQSLKNILGSKKAGSGPNSSTNSPKGPETKEVPGFL